MAAYYDTYDYPSYWKGREYENKSEIYALKQLMLMINNVSNILEVGAGYGRLLPYYAYRSKKNIITDPSSKLLSLAKKKIAAKFLTKRVKIIQARLENLQKKVKNNSIDLIIMVRVLHHIKDLDNAFTIIYNLLSPRGYFILEFPNKTHFKALLTEFGKGNLTFPIDLSSIDLRSKRNIKKGTIPFINYHPDLIYKKLEDHGFEIIYKKSVSNLRHPLFKRLLSFPSLMNLEKKLQDPLSKLNFGPSIFVLARKKG